MSFLPIMHFRKLFLLGKISREDYWLHVKSKLEVLDDIKNSFFDSINYLKMFKDNLLINFNFFENYDMNLLLYHNDVRSASNTILVNGTYEPVQMNLICQLAKEGSYFIDIGSNVGIFSIAVSLVNPKIRVSSFEPNIDIFEQQKMNFALNNVSSTNIYNYGLGNQTSESVDFFIPNLTGSGGGSLINLHPEEGPPDQTQIRIKKFDDLDDEITENIDLIKLDIEGAEFEFLKGSIKSISDSKPVIICELLRKWMKPFKSTPQNFLEILLGLNYICFEIRDGGLKEINVIDENTVANNFVFVHKKDLQNLVIINSFVY